MRVDARISGIRIKLKLEIYLLKLLKQLKVGMQVDARISRIHIKLKSNQPFCKLPAKQHCQSSLSGCSFLSSLALPSKRACLISTFLYSLHHASMKNSLLKFIYYIYLISGKVTFAYISFPAKNYINTNRVISSRPGKQPEMFARLFGVHANVIKLS